MASYTSPDCHYDATRTLLHTLLPNEIRYKVGDLCHSALPYRSAHDTLMMKGIVGAADSAPKSAVKMNGPRNMCRFTVNQNGIKRSPFRSNRERTTYVYIYNACPCVPYLT